MSLFDTDLIQKEIDPQVILDTLTGQLTYRGELPADANMKEFIEIDRGLVVNIYNGDVYNTCDERSYTWTNTPNTYDDSL